MLEVWRHARTLAHRVRAGLAAGLLMSLAACGGGGGGGVNEASPSSFNGGGSFRVTLDRTDIAYDYVEDAPVNTTVRLHATVSGTVPDNLYVGTTVEGEGLSTYIPLYYTASGADIDVTAVATQAGVYKGQLKFYACADNQCRQPIGGTPLTVNYSVTVHKSLKVPSQFTLGGLSGQGGSGKLAIQWPEGVSTGTVTLQSPVDWLTVGVPGTDGVTLTASSLRSGAYNATLLVSAGARTAQVSVTYTVVPPPTGEFDLRSSPVSLTFATVEGDAPAPQPIQIDLPTWGGQRSDVRYSIQYPGRSGWLQVTATETGALVTATAAQLPKGHYDAQVQVSLPGVTGTVVHVPVALTVGMGMVWPSSLGFDLKPGTLPAELAGETTVRQQSGTPFTWRATSGAAWLKLTRDAGMTGSTLSYVMDPVELAKIPNDTTVSAVVTITPSPSNVTPVSFSVTLTKHLAESHGVGPQVIVAGRPTTLYLSGSGFNAVPDLASALQTGGLNPTSVQLLNDRNIVMQLPALKAGTYQVGVRNGVDASTAARTVRVVDPVRYTYGAYPTGELSFCMTFDPVRQSVYMIGMASQRVLRYHFDGSGWARSAVSVPGLQALGLAPEGDSLITQSSSGLVSLLDPDALSTTFTVQSPLMGAQGYSCTIPSTHDGRSWLVMRDGWNKLMTFDHRTRTLQLPVIGAAALGNYFYNGPGISASRDGEHMVLMPSMAATPLPQMLYMDTSEGLFKPNPAGLTSGYYMPLSGDGSRMLDNGIVRDGHFGVVGQFYGTKPTGYRWGNGILSDDGSRVYVVSSPDEAFSSGVVTARPRVFVYDSSKSPDLGIDLPLLGYFELADLATCTGDYYAVNGCQPLDISLAISPDGQTLFYAGGRNLIVAPIPPESSLLSATGVPGRANAQGAGPRMAIQPWPKPLPR